MIAAFALAALELQEPRLASARTCALAFEEGERVVESLTCDFDGDDVADLIVATTNGARRRLSLFARRAGEPSFAPDPTATLDLTPDVIAFACIDVEGDPAREIALFNAGGAFAWRWRERDESKRFARLFACELLWQASSAGDIFHGQSWVFDLDGDGLEDVIVPGPSMHQVALQKRAGDGARSFAAPSTLAIDEERARGRASFGAPGGKRQVSVEFGDEGVSLGSRRASDATWIALEESVPSMHARDWDGDGDVDLWALSSASLFVFAQAPRGTFARAPLRVPNPVPIDRQRALDVSYSARCVDLDGDRRGDLVVFAGDKRADSPRTQVLVYLRGKEGDGLGRAGAPNQLLALDGFARPLQIEDIDGDGRPDLVVEALKPGLLDALKGGAERIDVELSVFRGGGGGFSKRADLVQRLSVEAGGAEHVVDFVGDLDGDGVRELFVRAEKKRIALFALKRTRDALALSSEPMWTLDIDERSRVLLPDRLSARTPDFFTLGPGSVRCTSFR